MRNPRLGRANLSRTAGHVLAVVALLATTACAGPGSASSGDEEVTVVATTTILGDVAREVVGDAGEVMTLMPLGADPHSYQPSAQQVDALTRADLVVANGAGLEGSLETALETAEEAGVEVFHAVDRTATLTLGGVDEAQEEQATEEGSEHTDDNHGPVDPHIWMDPVRMADVTRALGHEIAALGVEGAEGRAQRYAGDLEEVDAQITEVLADVPPESRSLVTNHEALAYFADRYDFEVVGTVVPSVSTSAEPSARDLESLVETIRTHGVRAIFLETTAPDRVAQAVAGEVGGEIEVVELYTGSLGEEGSGAQTYVDLLLTDAQRIADALGDAAAG